MAMKIRQSTYSEMVRYFTEYPPERGGIIGVKGDCICAFYADVHGECDETHYAPSIEHWQAVLRTWGENGISFGGVVHSHQPGLQSLSYCDIRFAKTILAQNQSLLDSVLFLLAMPDAECILISYRVSADGVDKESLTVLVEEVP